MTTGWTWEYVWENMTLPRLEVMNRLWKHCPPPNLSLAKLAALLSAFMGVHEPVKREPSEPPALLNEPDFED
jgi:hypothetical protein